MLIFLLASVVAFYAYTKINAPNLDAVDGVYKNSCCDDITIKRGLISQSGKTLDMKLLQMKFGLTGYVKAQFTKEGMREAEEETAISFSHEMDKRTLTVPVDDQDRTFKDDGNVTSR